MVDTARRAVAELAASQHRAFTRRQAADVRFDARRIATALRAGWLTEPEPGVLVLANGPPTWQQRLMVVTLVANGRGVASHRAAARLHGLDGFESSHNGTIEVSVRRTFRLQPKTAAVTHHVRPLARCDVTTVDGIRCTTLARTLCDLGSVVDERHVRRALTAARRRGIKLDELRASAERLHRPHQRGTGRLLRVLDAVTHEGRLPESWFEELVALCLRDPSLPGAVPQYPIRDSTGTTVARTDLGFPTARLGIEAHSRRFHFGPDAERLDEDRDITVARCGWELLYLGWHATRRPDDIVRVVRDVVRSRERTIRAAR